MNRKTEEQRLVLELREGKVEALEEAYTAHRTAIFGFLLRLAKDPSLAEDLFQNTWMKLARSASRLREDTDLRAWLFAVARNEFRSHRRWQLVDLSHLFLLAVQNEAAREKYETSDAASPGADALSAALDALGPSDREVLLLVCVEGLPREQAAQVLGINDAALRQRLARARARLKEKMTKLGTEPRVHKAERARQS